MPKPTTPDALARRALMEDIRDDRRGWLQHGAAALAVSLLGLGVAGSVVLTGSAQQSGIALPTAQVATPRTDVKLASAFDRQASTTSRDTTRPELDQAKLASLADQRAEELSKTDDKIAEAAQAEAADAREKALESASDAQQEQAEREARESVATKAAEAAERSASAEPAPAGETSPDASTVVNASGKSCMPVRGGYRVAASFGQVGSWSRYHTGFDFSAPLGTTLQAPASGVVTNAGSGPASGWAGNYVAIRYPDGTSSLQAHMSTVSVSVGQTVTSCQVVGAIGMTGRTFGPHVHFEIYPAGITPGDVYKAVNPVAWLAAHGLAP